MKSQPQLKNRTRPVNLELRTMSFPVTAVASALHRISGVLIFVSVGFLLWLLSLSLSSPSGFLQAVEIVDNFFAKFILWWVWTVLIYHILAGIRHMVMDVGLCDEIESARTTAKVTIVTTAVLSLIAGSLVW